MRKSIVLLALPTLLLLGANATAEDAPVRAAATKTVEVRDNFFSKAGSDSNLKSLRIKKDTIIKWVWGEDGQGTEVEHNVTCIKGNKCETEDFTMRAPYRKRITKTTVVVCTIHPTTMKTKFTVVNP